MPFCPECRGEYREDMIRCPICDVDLVSELGEDLRFMSSEQMRVMLADKELVAIRRGLFDTVREAHEVLRANQIPSAIAEFHHGANHEHGPIQWYQVLVAIDDQARAAAALEIFWARSHAETAEATPDPSTLGYVTEHEGNVTCPACGAVVRADTTECPECGLFLGSAPTGTDVGDGDGET